jgi:D-glycero-D-manno-heptose 1,7-bisphosphate phosphatase
MFDLKRIDKSWTLFLDRDGVINVEKYLDYVYDYTQFKFYKGSLDAIKKLTNIFGKSVVITNQRGVEKKLMTEDALIGLHEEMLAEIKAAGGKIDAIFYCTSLDNDHPNRKPHPGMALLAKERFPDIDLSKTIMVGNNLSDMHFGRNAGTFTVFVKTTDPGVELPNAAIDMAFNDLADFARHVV